ncbi:M20/M25/M40 family metallo-hydrolase [Desulfovibrio sp. OttesenSCG-928-I05]|nr:M20/M25/M40 family metallo-hydrolase [Desulfovibrio sp. OttesenSCG-928-I05]
MATPSKEAIKKAIEARMPAFLKDLETFVGIDSDTGNMKGSRTIADLLKPRIEAAGGTYEEIVSTERGGVHVIARFKGDGKKKGVVIVHTDTVFNTKGGNFPYRYDAQTGIAYGPGVGDCKASAIMALQVAEVFHELGHKPFKEYIVYFDSEEESGGSNIERETAVALAKESDYVLLADTGRPNFGVVTKRKTNGSYTFTVKGCGGHAGNAPHASANALVEACNLAVKARALSSPTPNDPWEYTTDAMAKRGESDTGQYIPDNFVNVAVLECANDKVNVVPDHAVLKVNLRCYEQKEHERIEKELKALADNPTVPWTTVTFEGKQTAKPMEMTAEAEKMLQLYSTIAKRECDKNVVVWTAGGVTLANQTAQVCPTIDAVGVDTDPMIEHTEKEFMEPALFVPRAVTMYNFIAEYDEQ